MQSTLRIQQRRAKDQNKNATNLAIPLEEFACLARTLGLIVIPNKGQYCNIVAVDFSYQRLNIDDPLLFSWPRAFLHYKKEGLCSLSPLLSSRYSLIC